MSWMTDCIEVTTGKSRGYGRSSITVGRNVVYWVQAHRLVYEVEHGPVPLGMVVCHTCDNPGCVNIDHMFLGTQGENLKDMARKGRGRNQNSGATQCKWGHEFTPENTIKVGKRRHCRECNRTHSQTYQHNKRALARKEENG
jgi:HNH endonuclease